MPGERVEAQPSPWPWLWRSKRSDHSAVQSMNRRLAAAPPTATSASCIVGADNGRPRSAGELRAATPSLRHCDPGTTPHSMRREQRDGLDARNVECGCRRRNARRRHVVRPSGIVSHHDSQPPNGRIHERGAAVDGTAQKDRVTAAAPREVRSTTSRAAPLEQHKRDPCFFRAASMPIASSTPMAVMLGCLV